MADVGRIYETNRAQANEEYNRRLMSRQYSREPLLAVMIAESGGVGQLRPDALSLVGGGNIPMGRREELLGSYQNNFFWQTGTGATNQTKNMTATDTVPAMSSPSTNSQAFLRKSAFFKWSKKVTELLVWNVTVELASGKFALGDAKLEAQNIGMQNHFDHLADELYIGNPSDQTADLWSEQLGINQGCDDNNTYGGVDRSVAGNSGWRGFRDTTTRAPSLDLQATFEIGLVGSYTQSVQEVSDGFDLVIWNRGAYLAVRREAQVMGGILMLDAIDKFARSGMKFEGFKRDRTVNIWSPRLKNWSATDSDDPNMTDYVFFARAGDWCFRTNPKMGVFRVGPWTDNGRYVSAGNDAQRALITTGYQFFTERAWSSLLAEAIAG